MKYKNAWKCSKCPECNDENGCPAWTELVMQNNITGETKLDKKCLFQFLPELMVEVIKASNRPAASMDAMRSEAVGQLNNIASAMRKMAGLQQDKSNGAIEHDG